MCEATFKLSDNLGRMVGSEHRRRRIWCPECGSFQHGVLGKLKDGTHYVRINFHLIGSQED